MKKHPVDDLFARKLAEWEPKASPDLWKRIETRQQKPARRLGGWYWFAAAGISVTLLAGYLVWQSELAHPGNAGNRVAQQEQERIPKEKSKAQTSPVESTGQLAEATPASPQKASKGLPQSAIRKEVVNPGSRPAVSLPTEPAPILDDVQVAAIGDEEKEPVQLPVDPNLKTTQPVEVPPLVEPDAEASQTRVIVAHIQTDEADLDDQKSSKFIRILRQLKNAKQGEAVDWDEVGFNPKKLMARADERLRYEEDKLVKQYQNLKDKTKL